MVWECLKATISNITVKLLLDREHLYEHLNALVNSIVILTCKNSLVNDNHVLVNYLHILIVRFGNYL